MSSASNLIVVVQNECAMDVPNSYEDLDKALNGVIDAV